MPTAVTSTRRRLAAAEQTETDRYHAKPMTAQRPAGLEVRQNGKLQGGMKLMP
jgi:hypothetical protein